MTENAPLLRPIHTLPARSLLYILYAVPYIFVHPPVRRPVLALMPALITVYLTVLAVFFTFLYIPHVLILSIFHGPVLAASYAAVMILSESSAIVSIIAESFLTEKHIIDMFDIVLLERTENHTNGLTQRVQRMIAEKRVLGRDERGEWILGEHHVPPYLKFKDSIKASLLFILELPLNFIPGVGTPLFLCLQGYHLGPLHHYRYTQLLGYDDRMREAHIYHNRVQYSLFGLGHVILQMIPILNTFFLFATGAGAGLWASKSEVREWEHEQEHLKAAPASPTPQYAPGYLRLPPEVPYYPQVPHVAPSPHGNPYPNYGSSSAHVPSQH